MLLLFVTVVPVAQRPASAENEKNPGKTQKYLGFSGYFRVLPAVDTRYRRGSLPGLPYCCSVGLTLATVLLESPTVVLLLLTVNTSNTVPALNV